MTFYKQVKVACGLQPATQRSIMSSRFNQNYISLTTRRIGVTRL